MDYNSRYNKEERYWGTDPHPLVRVSLPFLSLPAKVLDLGCGEGKDALYLARKGFDITTIDSSEKGISKLEVYSQKEKLNITTKIADLKSFLETCETFDSIVGINILQFVHQEDLVSTNLFLERPFCHFRCFTFLGVNMVIKVCRLYKSKPLHRWYRIW